MAMEQDPSPQPLSGRLAQQRAAVLAVIGSDAPAAPAIPAAPVETDVETRRASSLPPPTNPPVEPTPPPADVVPEPVPAIDVAPEPVAPAAPAIPAVPVAAPIPPVEPTRPAQKPRRHFLSRFVHRRAVKANAPLAPVATHPVAAHRRHYLRWVTAVLLAAALAPAAAWLAIYRLGADGFAARAVAELVPLRAGRAGSHVLTLSDLYSRVEWQPKLNASPLAALAPVSEGDKRAAFQAWVDEQLVRAELVRRGQAVTAEQLSRELDRIQRGIGAGVDLPSWTGSTYGLTVPEFREAILRPAVERARLAVILVADRQRYSQAWQQAEAASRVRGLVGMADQGWVDALDIGPAAADAIAATSRDTRTAPVPTPEGLAVYRFSESATDDSGATHWHLWQLTFPVRAVDDFLAQERLAADAAFYLP